MNNEFTALARLTKQISLVSYVGLLAVFTLGTLVSPSCNRDPNWVIWALHVLPLLVFLPGLLRQNVRSYVWMTFLLLGYFMMSVATVFACTSTLMLVEVALIVVLFIAAMMYVRWRSKEIKQTQAENSSTDTQES